MHINSAAAAAAKKEEEMNSKIHINILNECVFHRAKWRIFEAHDKIGPIFEWLACVSGVCLHSLWTLSISMHSD